MKTNTAELPKVIARLGARLRSVPRPPAKRRTTCVASDDHNGLSSDIIDHRPRDWTIDTLAGTFAELSSSGETACLTIAVSLIRNAQHRGEPAAWIAIGNSIFFPPDVAESGVDLDALPVVRVADNLAAARAADHLLRSGGFALVVVDLGVHNYIRIPLQSRLAGLARKHHTLLLCLTKKRSDSSSIGSLVSIRGEATVRKTSFNRFTWEVHVIKDKRRGPGWSHAEVCRGPDGMC